MSTARRGTRPTLRKTALRKTALRKTVYSSRFEFCHGLLGLGTLVVAWLASGPAVHAAASPADRLLASIPLERRAALDAVLARNPDIARARAHVAAAEARAPQVRSLDDPTVGVGLFLLPPETRVGPQRLALSIRQQIPGFGKRALREQAALSGAVAVAADLEALRLGTLTEARRLLDELWFLDAQARIADEEREHLVRHEEAARARYTAGKGLQQEVIKIQAEITRAERRLLDIESRRRQLMARFNALRDRPADTPVPVAEPVASAVGLLALEPLRRLAYRDRPEVWASAARLEQRRSLEALAEKGFKPDFQVGLGYTVVEGRNDSAARANPPEGNGDDILMLEAAVRWPVRKGRLGAAIDEARAHRRMAEEDERRIVSTLERELGDLVARVPLLREEWTLLDSVLLAQAEEALRSAEAAYASGQQGALDLLDAEHVLFQVRTAIARTRADHSIAMARLEAAVGGPLPGPLDPGPQDSNPQDSNPLDPTTASTTMDSQDGGEPWAQK